MLRVPSCLPVVVHAPAAAATEETPIFYLRDDHAIWYLPSRKNWARPSVVRRSCTCAICRLTCPVHVLGAAFSGMPAGTSPFASISRNRAIQLLRQMLKLQHVDDADSFGTHDCRRGHCDDMIRAGSGLGEILIAGGWRSPGGQRSYVDMVDLEQRATLEAHYATLAEAD